MLQGRFGRLENDDYEENGNLPEVFMDKLDSKAVRENNAADQNTNNQAAMTAWQ